MPASILGTKFTCPSGLYNYLASLDMAGTASCLGGSVGKIYTFLDHRSSQGYIFPMQYSNSVPSGVCSGVHGG